MKKQRSTIIYTAYSAVIFIFLCCIFVPLLLLLAQKKSWHLVALKLHKVWSRSFFFMVFIRWEIIGEEKIQPNQEYIFCSNHFSYLDIPAVLLLNHSKFIGKSSIGNIPIFGHFYKKIHILVDRANAQSRMGSLRLTQKALRDGFNVTFFPEGGIHIPVERLPYMNSFKDGAFRLAIQTDTPIIPLTMPYNFLILPDRTPFRFHWHRCKIIVHDPVFPQPNENAEIGRLKKEVFDAIQNELLAHHPERKTSEA